jgi:hypothetical protein
VILDREVDVEIEVVYAGLDTVVRGTVTEGHCGCCTRRAAQSFVEVDAVVV